MDSEIPSDLGLLRATVAGKTTKAKKRNLSRKIQTGRGKKKLAV